MTSENNNNLAQGFTLGECVVEPQRERLLIGGEAKHLEPKVMQVLVELARHAQSPLSREQLLETVWTDTVVGEEVLSRAISVLRTALGDERTNPTYIRTIPRHGYELILPVKPLPEKGAKVWPKLAVGLSVLMLVLLLVWWWPEQPHDRVVVMLPISAATTELGGLANGLNDAVYDLLSAGEGLQVVARSWSFAVRDPNVAPQGIADKFGANYLLEGSLANDGDHYRLSLEMVDAATGRSAWRQQYRAADPDALTQQVLNGARAALNKQIDARIGDLSSARREINEAAYLDYLQARHHWSLRGAQHISRASYLLKRSISMDPQFAEAHLALAQVTALEPFYSPDIDLQDRFVAARGHLSWVLSLDPSLRSRVQALEGFMRLRSRDWLGAQQNLQASIAGDPGYALGHYWASMYHAAVGDYPQSLIHAQRAVELEPATPVFRDRLGVAYLWVNDQQAAAAEFVRAEELGFALDFRSKAYLLYLYRARQYELMSSVLRTMQLPPAWIEAFISGLSDPGKRTAAVQATEQTIAAGQLPRDLHFGAWVLLQAPERALAAFDLDYRSPDVELLWATECNMLRELPGYADLVQRLNLSQSQKT